MHRFQILANDYLSVNVDAFYHIEYTGMGNLGNPDYLNTLKNTFNDFSEYRLNSAVQELETALREDIPQVRSILCLNNITVCVVPRAKAENSYHPNQQLFRTTVQKVIKEEGFIDGTHYILRHTNTKTTHLRRTIAGYTNDGPDPYPGITQDTCTISPNIKGMNILLVDDIYTPGVNIDEDCISALLKIGASSVTFYAVGKVNR